MESDTIPQVVVPVEKELGCWGLRELIGHPPFPRGPGVTRVEIELWALLLCSKVGGAASYYLLPGSRPCPFGRRLSKAKHTSAGPVWGPKGDRRRFSLTFPIGERSCQPLLGKCEMWAMRHLNSSGDSKQTPLIHPRCLALLSIWTASSCFILPNYPPNSLWFANVNTLTRLLANKQGACHQQKVSL